MYCSKCGSEIKDDDECGYCKKCGLYVPVPQKYYPNKALSDKAQKALIFSYISLGIHFPLSVAAEGFLFEATGGGIFFVMLLIQFVALSFGIKAMVYEWRRTGISLSFFFIFLTLIFLFYPLLLDDISCIYFDFATWGDYRFFF